MSKLFIQSFFPSGMALLEQRLPRLVECLFPFDVAQQCPEVSVGRIRNPVLALAALLGIGVGMYGFQRYFSCYLKKKQFIRDHERKNTATRAAEANETDTVLLWSLAFFCFSGMNLVALPLHCLVPPLVETYPRQYPLLWMLDCVLTGASSLALVGAARNETTQLIKRLPLATQSKGSWERLLVLLHLPVLGNILPTTGRSLMWWNALFGVASVFAFFIYETTLLMELVYLGPMILAFPLLLQFLLVSYNDTLSHSWGVVVLFVFVGCATTLGSIFWDAPACRTWGLQTYDLWFAGTGVFAGSNLVFAGLAVRVGWDSATTRTTKIHSN